VEVAEIGLALDDAIPCGLIVNELVTNALKHAFPARRNGCILVCLRALDTGELELMVSDDGVGLPLGIEPGPASLGSSGLDLVFTFVEQLRAHVEIHRAGGTRFSVRFTPTPWASKRIG
jgi:two-component system, sensor histidine kinase PdtaS